jgi:uncharacterized membrane protein YqjE
MVIEASSSQPNPAILEEASTADLVREAVDEGRELVRLEIALAKEEVKVELKQLERAAISGGVAIAASLLMLSSLAVALVLALGGTVLAALFVALGFLILAGAAGLLGYGMLPKVPLEKTRHRFENDVNQLKEHIA